MSKKDQVKRAFDQIIKEFNYIDIVVGNAGIICEHDYERTINVNLVSKESQLHNAAYNPTLDLKLGILHSTYAAIEKMSKEKGGHGGIIINVSSRAGLISAPWMPAYSASKHGIVGLNRSFGVSAFCR